MWWLVYRAVYSSELACGKRTDSVDLADLNDRE
jgi:hypothetical protein